MNRKKEWLDKAARFLEQEMETFGTFSLNGTLPTSAASAPGKQNSASPATTSRSGSLPSGPASQKPPAKATDTSDLNQCTDLQQLEALCRNAEELRTDLENTNLVFGVGNPDADLLIIGEAPGYHEDQQGEPFVGKAGQLLDNILSAIQLSRDEVYITNIVKHRPPENRDPKPEESTRSLPYLQRQIELIDPKLILCLGRISAITLLKREETLGSMRGKFHPFMNRELMVTYHPAALLRNPKWKRATWEDVKLLKVRYDLLTKTEL